MKAYAPRGISRTGAERQTRCNAKGYPRIGKFIRVAVSLATRRVAKKAMRRIGKRIAKEGATESG